MRKRENKNYSSVTFLSDAQQKLPKKTAKQFKKLKNTIMASFQAKIGWKRMRNMENKNYRFISFLQDAQKKIPKNTKKSKKYHCGFISSKN